MLGAGSHTFTIDAYNKKKTYAKSPLRSCLTTYWWRGNNNEFMGDQRKSNQYTVSWVTKGSCCKVLGYILLNGLLLLSLMLLGCTTLPEGQATRVAVKKESLALEEKWGIQIQTTRMSAAGFIIDFRYRVIDSEKAAPLFNRQTKPYLIDQASGKKLAVPNPPKIGPLRTSNKPQANRIYFILFSNPGGFVKSGNRVTVVIGDFKADNLVVE